jgi:AAA family ATPase
MRPGRLDRILYVGPPDRAGREEILAIRLRSMTVGPDVDIHTIADLVSNYVILKILICCLTCVSSIADGGMFWS